MAAVIGVVGPHDVVDAVIPYCFEQDDVTALSLDYADEAEAPAIVAAQADNVSGWLFTGIGPYTRAERAGVIDRPAVYLPYTREALQLALVGLLRSHQDIDRLSIDTMSNNAVQHCFEHAGIDTSHIRVLPFRADLTTSDYAEFHRRAHRDETAASHAITCLSSVHELVGAELPTIRLRPTRHAIRNTLRHLKLSVDEAALGHAQIVLGLVETSPGTSNVIRHLTELSASVGQRPDGTLLIATTRGRLAEASHEFTELPLLRRLAELSDRVQVGFGLGRTAAEAELLARRALTRARRAGPVAAVLSRRNDADVVLAEKAPATAGRPQTLDELAQQTGIASNTLSVIQTLDGDVPVTAMLLADRLGLQARSARRVLAKLEGAGLAQRAGEAPSGSRGRPATVYRIQLP